MEIPSYFSNMLKSENVVLASQIISEKQREPVSTGSVSLDWASGGLTRGTLSLTWGPPGCGKTTLALLLLAKELQKFPDKLGIWIDTEYSFDSDRARSLGVDTKRVIVFQSNLFEKAVAPLGKIEAELIKDKKLCFIGLDSIKGLTSINEHSQMAEGNVEGAANAYGGIAKSVNPALNLLNRITFETKCITILTNHAMANMDARTSTYTPYVLSGGQKLKHLCSTIIFLAKPESKDARLVNDSLTDLSGHNVAYGSLIRAKVTKTRRTVEGKTAEFYWNLETGEFEKREMELVRLAKGLGIVQTKGAWLTFGPEATALKAQGIEKFASYLTDTNLFNKILNACNDVKINRSVDMNTDFIDVEAEEKPIQS